MQMSVVIDGVTINMVPTFLEIVVFIFKLFDSVQNLAVHFITATASLLCTVNTN